MTAPTVDEDARRHIVEDLDRSYLVEAGAGTGKTTGLVGRVVHIVATGHARLDEIAAITFTEAAAAELLERVREALELVASGRSIEYPAAAQRDRAAEALREIDDASVTTLHAFAQHVLSEFALDAGLPPGFEVVDDIEASAAFDERWQAFVDELFERPAAQRPLLVAFAFDLTRRHLEAVARSLHDHWDRLAEPTRWPAVGELTVGPLLVALDAATARADACLDPADTLCRHLRRLGCWAGELASAGDELDRLVALADAPRIRSGNAGRQANWPAGGKAEIAALLDDAQQALDATVGDAKRAAVHYLLDALVEFTLRSARERRQAGRLEFHDLLTLARNLLRESSTVRTTLHHRYRTLLLDEFQDTDPLQIEIAALIATDRADVEGQAWDALPVPDGRLFIVGDPKQSIYRFRRADIALYRQVHRTLAAEHRRLAANFRSRPGILAWVDHCFAGLMGDGGELQAPYERLHAIRAADTRPAVGFLGSPDDTRPLAEIRRIEAGEIAGVIDRIRVEGWTVAAPTATDPAAVRAAELDDIAVLLPTRTGLSYLEDALERHGIPMRIESQSMVFATDEVRTVLAVLEAIDDPTDQLAVVGALRSSAFACSDHELAEWRFGGRGFDYRADPPAPLADHPVARAQLALRALHEARMWQTVAETVDDVIRGRRLLEIATASTRPRDRWRRYRIVADAAHSYSSAPGATLRGFVAWMQRQRDEGARLVERVLPEPDDHAVRILTVHGAKGLEFPIVILAGLNAAPRARGARTYVDDGGHLEARIGLKDSGFETAGYEQRRRRENDADTQESIRVLYVAATRARDHLIVSLHRPARSGCAAELLGSAADSAPELWTRLEPWPGKPRATVERAAPSNGRAELAARAAWITRHAEVVTAGCTPTVSATALAARIAGERAGPRGAGRGVDAGADRSVDGSVPWRRGRAGTAVGRAVHGVLQTVDLAHRTGLAELCRAQALAEGVAEHAPEITRLVESVLAGGAVRRATAARYWREVPVAASVDGTVVDGYIDLLVDGPDGLEIVDYKTDAVEDAARRAAAIDRYEVQAGAYALALTTATGRTVGRVTLVFARRGDPFEHSVADVPRLVARVRASLAPPGGA
ncbi:MAG: UvrD-helicase domain-containing protein [Acidimicrobiia bacterium]